MSDIVFLHARQKARRVSESGADYACAVERVRQKSHAGRVVFALALFLIIAVAGRM